MSTTQVQSTFVVCSLGKQESSLKPTVGAFSFGTSSRDQLAKTYLTKEHDKRKIADCSPGPVYSFTYHTGKASPRYGFGTSQKLVAPGDPYGESTIEANAISANPISVQDLKFKQQGSAVFGYDIREQNRNAAVTMCHPCAGMGVTSPGPTAYSPDQIIVKERRPRYTFPGRREAGVGKKDPSTPRCVGPGSYHVAQSAMGAQPVSARKTSNNFSFGRAQRLNYTPGEGGMERSSELSSLGKQVLSTGKSSAAYGFGTATREHPGMGIKSSGRTKQLPHPKLDLERDRVKYS